MYQFSNTIRTVTCTYLGSGIKHAIGTPAEEAPVVLSRKKAVTARAVAHTTLHTFSLCGLLIIHRSVGRRRTVTRPTFDHHLCCVLPSSMLVRLRADPFRSDAPSTFP